MVGIGNCFSIRPFHSRSEQAQNVEMHHRPYRQSLSLNPRKLRIRMSGNIVNDTVRRRNDIVGPAPDGINPRTHIRVPVFQVNAFCQCSLALAIVVEVQLGYFVNESE